MRKYIIPFIAFIFFSNHSSEGQTLEVILARHHDAIGKEGLENIRSVILEIKERNELGQEKIYSITKKRPEKIRVEGIWEGQKYISAFDGVRAWTIAPWTGVSIPQLMTEMEKEELMLNAHIDSPLLFEDDYDKQLDLIRGVILGEDEYHVVRMTLPSGKWVDFFINKSLNHEKLDEPAPNGEVGTRIVEIIEQATKSLQKNLATSN